MHVKSQRLWQHTQTAGESHPGLITEMGEDTQVKSSVQLIAAGKRKSQFSPMRRHSGYQPHSRAHG